MNGQRLHSVFIVEDHAAIAGLIGDFIRGLTGFTFGGSAHDARSAISALWEQPADVVLLDLGLPDHNGLDIIPEIRAVAPDARVLIFSALMTPHTVREAMRQEAMGFIEKSAPLPHLESALRQAVAGKVALGPSAGEILGDIVRGKMEGAELGFRHVEILSLLANGKSVKEIATRVGRSIPCVYKLISRMKQRTGSRTVMELVIKARNKGLLSTEAPPPSRP
jgi:DNA-binding NarL/FixJ family response regulator